MDKRQLESRSRDELITLADGLGVSQPSTLTQPELVDEILVAGAAARGQRPPPRGLFGRARDLLKSVVSRGLHLPQTAARVLRNPGVPPDGSRAPRPPVPTMTLAEIYAAQGHLSRAISVLDEVITRNPDHDEALALKRKLEGEIAKRDPRPAARGPASPDDSVSVGEAELPDRYEIDEVVAIAVDPTTLYLYWEVRPTTFAAARAAQPGGRLLLRIVSVNPAGLMMTEAAAPFAEQRDVPIDGLLGEMFVRNLAPGSNVRVSIGWEHGLSFDPIAVGLELATPRESVGVAADGPPSIMDPHAAEAVSRRLEEMLAREGKRLVSMTIPGAARGGVRAFDPAGHPIATAVPEGARTIAGDGGQPVTEVLWVVRTPGASDLSRRRTAHRGASELSRGASELSRGNVLSRAGA
jgi:hypothetical protein